jgi:hypothetical protein
MYNIDGISMRVNYKHVYVWVKAENGYSQTQVVSTAGDVSWTFSIPANQSDQVQACAAGSLISSLLNSNCVFVHNTGQDQTVSLSAPQNNYQFTRSELN